MIETPTRDLDAAFRVTPSVAVRPTYTACTVTEPAPPAVSRPACVMVARLVFEEDHVGPVVKFAVLPSEYDTLAVYCAVCPTVTLVDPRIDKPVTVGAPPATLIE